MAVGARIRERQAEIVKRWVATAPVAAPSLATLDRASLIDHLPEFLDGLASWVEGDTETARRGFAALVDGHAMQRLGAGIDLSALTREYALLRSILLRELEDLSGSDITRLNEGMDEAIYEAVRRYSARRDVVRDRFVGILGHDLRSPLHSITMVASHMAAGRVLEKEAQLEIGTLVQRTAYRMNRMIEDLLAFTRVQLGGQIPIALTEGDLGNLCAEAFEELRTAYPKRDMRFERTGDLRGMWDSDRMLQAIANLISNAVKHGRDPITVSVAEVSDRKSIIVSVNSRGDVIPIEQLDKLFDPLRLESPEMKAGLGLGLFVVRQVALGHAGRCEVDSDAEHGTTFRMLLPRTLTEVPRED